MRILYGISGDGFGQTLRARVVAGHLLTLGHDVRLAAAGHAARMLRRHGFEVVPVHDAPAALDLATSFRADAVVTDCSSFACLVAELTGAPLFAVGGRRGGFEGFVRPRARVVDVPSDAAVARAVERLLEDVA